MRVEVDHLHQGVDTCIGASGAKSRDRHGAKTPQGGFQLILHGLPAWLALPTLVGTAAITDAERYAHVCRSALAQLGEEALRLGLQIAGSGIYHFLGQGSCAIVVADGLEFFSQCQLGGECVVR